MPAVPFQNRRSSFALVRMTLGFGTIVGMLHFPERDGDALLFTKRTAGHFPPCCRICLIVLLVFSVFLWLVVWFVGCISQSSLQLFATAGRAPLRLANEAGGQALQLLLLSIGVWIDNDLGMLALTRLTIMELLA